MGELTRSDIDGWLTRLCDDFPDRHVGGPGNRAATQLFADVTAALGFEVETVELPCVVWEHGDAALEASGGETYVLHAGPYSRAIAARGELAAAGTVEELEAGSFEGSVLLVHGDLVREQLMAKGFTFFNPDSHKRIVAALEASGALAVLAATGRDPGLAGGLYPFPLVEDGDFALPTAYLTDVTGLRLLEHVGEEVALRIDSRQLPATCEQPVARKRGTGDGRVVAFGHIDSKDGSPGALDNATGVAVLLGMAKLLADAGLRHMLELVPLNGEDYYAATGQMHWLAANAGAFGDIALGLNADGAGFVGHTTDVSLYGVPEPLASHVREAVARHGFAEGPQWPQSDHSMFVMNGVPAIAAISQDAFFVLSTVAHTPADTTAEVDADAVAEVARFFADLVSAVDAGDR